MKRDLAHLAEKFRPSFPRPAMRPLKLKSRFHSLGTCQVMRIFRHIRRHSKLATQPTDVRGGRQNNVPNPLKVSAYDSPTLAVDHRAITALAREARACHKLSMNTEPMYPYSLEVMPCEKPAGHFQWSIRERGRLIQRSDRPHPSESKAREKGQAELERLFFGGRDRR